MHVVPVLRVGLAGGRNFDDVDFSSFRNTARPTALAVIGWLRARLAAFGAVPRLCGCARHLFISMEATAISHAVKAVTPTSTAWRERKSQGKGYVPVSLRQLGQAAWEPFILGRALAEPLIQRSTRAAAAAPELCPPIEP